MLSVDLAKETEIAEAIFVVPFTPFIFIALCIQIMIIVQFQTVFPPITVVGFLRVPVGVAHGFVSGYFERVRFPDEYFFVCASSRCPHAIA